MQPGARVLIHAGASGVGIAANQLARGFGASEVFTTAGSKDKCDFLKNKIGVDHAINYKEQDFAEEVWPGPGASHTLCTQRIEPSLPATSRSAKPRTAKAWTSLSIS